MSKIKTLFQLSIFLVFVHYFAQNNYVSIEFKPENESYTESDYHIYKNDSLVYSNCYLKNDFSILSHLKKGNYLLKYDTVFGINSIELNFESDRSYKKIILETEKISKKKLAQTFSYVESLKNNERITLQYSLSACFVSKNKEAIILKENDEYFFIEYKRRRLIGKINIQKIIRHEKILKSLNSKKNIHNSVLHSTCSEFFSLTKNGTQVYGKNIYCGDWSESSDIKRWIK
jgi:hypothetical protein